MGAGDGAPAGNLKPTQSKLKEAIRKMSFKKNRHQAEPFSNNIKLRKTENTCICMLYVEGCK